MNRWRQWQTACAMLLLTFTLAPTLAFGQSKQVQAEIPPFPVKVNGTLVDNIHSPYPLLLYKNITYFPLTWDMAQALQWQVNWSEAEGLKVYSAVTTRGGGAYGYSKSPLHQDLTVVNRLSVLYRAQLPEFPVWIGSDYIDNANEPYPLLTFRDITYFPLTWRFAHDLLHIDLQWDQAEGLSVRSPQQPVLGRLLFDDADYLYFNPALVTKPEYALLKVNKSLEETPAWVTKDEVKAAFPNLDLNHYLRPNGGSDATAELRTEGDTVYYKSMKLDTEPYPAQQPVRNATWIPLGDQDRLLSLTTRDPIIGVPLRTPPYRAELFHVKGDSAAKLPGFKDVPQGIVSNADGSRWIYANIDRKGDIRDNYYRSAQLALLDKDGSFHLINDQVSAKFINVLGADNVASNRPVQSDGTIVFETAQPNPSLGLYLKPGGTIYSIDTKRQVKQMITYEQGISFLDRSGRIFVYDPDKNAVTSLSDNKTAFWWDYELIGP
ncbi:hypothetical protein O9H85_16665 [Paenibacillus filicis]|uniref:Copper amine oxidase-like N-terminal domain-containing protein n=1 Tax=Paenibacillus gyeongsangnamensis TaxID=3388067 RepID=A0ABT4QB17_9BACL|nr:hypothetical protein [Paenibacillus filicis]MCZ8514025.1 hypothetical protein [Paenibacillus filicis]